MKTKVYSFIFSLFFIAVIFQACTDSNPVTPVNPTGMISYGTKYAVGSKAKVELFAADSFRVGYNKVYMKVTDSASGAIITDAHVHIDPFITIAGTTVGGPSHSPHGEAPTYQDMYEGYVIFTSEGNMPGADKWYLKVRVHNHMPTPAVGGETSFTDLKVHNNAGKFTTTIGPDGAQYFWSYVEPKTPAIGMNNFEFVAYKKSSNLSFPAVDSLNVVVKPWMESMGHGSPNNENPVFQGDGLYKGRVNFTMSGDWRLYINTTNTSGQKDSTYFDIVF